MTAQLNITVFVIPEGNSDAAREIGVENVTALFTPDQSFLATQVPLLGTLEIMNLDIPEDDLIDGVNPDYTRLTTVLNAANDNTFVIYIRSTTVSVVPPNELVKLIYDLAVAQLNSSEGDKENFDAMYLAKWADRCDQFRSLDTSAINAGVNLIETVRPHGIQSVFFSPSGAAKILALLDEPVDYPVSVLLTHLIANKNIRALSTTPPVMNFDSAAAITAADYIKTHECTDIPVDTGVDTPQGSNMSIAVFIFILLIVIGIFYFLITMVSRSESSNHSPHKVFDSTAPESFLNIGGE
jgi:hypothetical protein